MAKYYFRNGDDEYCYTLDAHIEHMAENNIEEMEVFEAKVDRGTDGYFFCKIEQEIGESGHCGNQCFNYEPRNNKNGICKHHGYLYEKTDISRMLNIEFV